MAGHCDLDGCLVSVGEVDTKPGASCRFLSGACKAASALRSAMHSTGRRVWGWILRQCVEKGRRFGCNRKRKGLCLSAAIQRASLLSAATEESCGSSTATAHLGHHFLELAHFLHHLLHLTEPFEKAVEFGDTNSASLGNPDPAFGVEDLRMPPFLQRHGANHAFHAFKFLFSLAQISLFEHIRAAREHADDAFKGSELFHLPQLIEKILPNNIPDKNNLLRAQFYLLFFSRE